MLIRTALVVIMFWVAAPVVQACFCIPPEVKEGFERAQVVFLGEVVEIIPARSTDVNAPFADRSQTIRFKVEITWKGPFWAEANVLAPIHDCFTIHPERTGAKYIVYGKLVPGSANAINNVVVDACNRTTWFPTPTQPGVFEHLYGGNSVDDVRLLNVMIMMSSPRPRPEPVRWLKFLDH